MKLDFGAVSNLNNEEKEIIINKNTNEELSIGKIPSLSLGMSGNSFEIKRGALKKNSKKSD